MDILEIKNIIGETTEYDKKLKLEVKKPKSWCKSISAFANTLGGFLIFGISDDNQIVGLETPDKDAELISEIIKTRLNPIPEFKISFHTEDGNVLLIVQVFKGEETPYYYSGDGLLEAYVRIGNESAKASPIELKRLVLRGRNTTFDSQNSMYKVEDYAFSKLRERYKKWTGNSFDEKDLVSFGLATEQGYLTNAGALIADESPIRYSRIFCTRWNGLNKSGGTFDALDDAEYEGSVISLIDNGEAFIKRNAKMMWKKTANSREEMPEYVERSYHEALVNAIAHRDYSFSGSNLVNVYEDRIEFVSLGGLVSGLELKSIFLGVSQSRNPNLAAVFYRMRLIESYGTGIGKIERAYKACPFQPEFETAKGVFRVTLPNRNEEQEAEVQKTENVKNDISLDEQKNLIIQYARENGSITRKEVEDLIGAGTTKAFRLLKELCEVDKLEQKGSGKLSAYFIK